MKDGTCRTCQAPMRWALTNTGKRNPLDPEPTEDGNVVVLAAGTERGELEVCVVLREETLDRARLLGLRLYTSHFATCPDRQEHQRKAKPDDPPRLPT